MFQIIFAIYVNFVVLLVYFCTEDWFWHASQTAENRFWGFWSTSLMACVLYVPDSPFAVMAPYRAWYIDLSLLYLAFVLMRSFVRFREQKRLGQIGENLMGLFNLPFIDHAAHGEAERRPSQLAVRASQDITALAKRLQYNIAPTTTRALSNKDIIDSEIKIIERMRTVPRSDLSRIITHLNFSQLIFNVRDHYRFSDKKHKEALLDVLCVERLHALDPPARAAVLNALQVSETIRAHPRGQEWARHIICHSEGIQLNLMKLLLDNTGTYHNLHKLVYTDVTDPMIRESIIRHIRTQALLLRDQRDEGEYIMLKATGDQLPRNHKHKDDDLPFADVTVRSRRHQAPNIKIFSDVDDTLYCSGGDGIAGVDTMFPRKQIYPGVLEFYRQLDIGPNDESGEWNKGRLGNLVFLSARPHVYKDVAERASYNLFQKMRTERGLYCNPTMLAGQVTMETMRSMNLELGGKGLHLAKFASILNKKLSNFEEFCELYPEYNSVLIGDNGQGDVMVVQRAKEAGRPITGAFIHTVIPLEKTFGYEEGSRELWESMGIHFFDTYVGAAVAAFEQGLISVSGLESIARKARSALVATLDKAPLTGRSGWSPEKRRAWCEMFNDDLALCNGHLPFDEIEEVPLPEVVTEAVAEAVDTLAATRDTTDALKPVESIPFSETPLPAQALPTHEAPSKAAEPSQALSAPAGAPAPATTPPVLATTVDTVSKATAELQTVVDRATEAKVAADGQAGLNETEKAAVRTEVLMAMKDVLMTLLPKRYSTASGESLPLAEAPANTTATELAGPGAAASGAGTTSTTQCGATLALDRQLGASETTQAAPADGMEPLATIHSVGDSGLLSTALTPSTTPREPGSEGEDDDIQTSVPSAPVFESITTESVPDDEGTGPVPQPEVGDSTSQLQQALAAVGEMVGMVSDLTGSTANKPEASTHTSIAETGAASPRGDETPAPGVADEDRTNTMDIPTKPSAQAGGAQPVQVDGAEKENVAEQVEVRVDTDHAAEETGQSEGAADKTNESEHEGDKVDVPIGVREAVTELAKNAVKTPEADTQP